MTERPGCGGTCQAMTCSPSAVARTTSSAAGKPAATGAVCAVRRGK